jgi:hypothetical protein
MVRAARAKYFSQGTLITLKSRENFKAIEIEKSLRVVWVEVSIKIIYTNTRILLFSQFWWNKIKCIK